MDVLKQLEAKLQTLLQQRAALKEEVDRLKAGRSEELEGLRAQVQEARAEAEALRDERETLRRDVEAILALVEGLQ